MNLGHSVTVITGAPAGFFLRELSSPRLAVRKASLDFGAKQKDAFSVDMSGKLFQLVAATLVRTLQYFDGIAAYIVVLNRGMRPSHFKSLIGTDQVLPDGLVEETHLMFFSNARSIYAGNIMFLTSYSQCTQCTVCTCTLIIGARHLALWGAQHPWRATTG